MSLCIGGSLVVIRRIAIVVLFLVGSFIGFVRPLDGIKCREVILIKQNAFLGRSYGHIS
jgi:hypothetical protein